jgi:hypothetical protein
MANCNKSPKGFCRNLVSGFRIAHVFSITSRHPGLFYLFFCVPTSLLGYDSGFDVAPFEGLKNPHFVGEILRAEPEIRCGLKQS